MQNDQLSCLPASVYAVERLFVKKARKRMFVRDLLHKFHRELVVIGGNVYDGENGREFVLSGSDFVVSRFGKHAEFPQLFVEFRHKLKSRAGRIEP